jgi:hypothetical protein
MSAQFRKNAVQADFKECYNAVYSFCKWRSDLGWWAAIVRPSVSHYLQWPLIRNALIKKLVADGFSVRCNYYCDCHKSYKCEGTRFQTLEVSWYEY